MTQHWFIWKKRSLLRGVVAFLMTLLMVLALKTAYSKEIGVPPSASKSIQERSLEQALSNLPVARPHPLPPSLAQWHDPQKTGDYFDQIRPTVVGALIWSHFPITVYVQPPERQGSPFLVERSQMWVKAINHALQEWNTYLPLTQVEQAQDADITIWRTAPPLRFERRQDAQGNDRRSLPISRARSAEAVFELYAKPSSESQPSRLLAHRIKINIRPDQAVPYLEATARHELGHALGIWGHSPQQTDALYFSQVRNPAKISVRDINTLKRVYEQPTRLGWQMKELQKRESENQQKTIQKNEIDSKRNTN